MGKLTPEQSRMFAKKISEYNSKTPMSKLKEEERFRMLKLSNRLLKVLRDFDSGKTEKLEISKDFNEILK